MNVALPIQCTPVYLHQRYHCAGESEDSDSGEEGDVDIESMDISDTEISKGNVNHSGVLKIMSIIIIIIIIMIILIIKFVL